MQVWNLILSKFNFYCSASYSVAANTYSSTVGELFIFEVIDNYSITIYAVLLSSFSTLLVLSELLYLLIADSLSSNMLDSLIVSVKFLLLVALLVFIRGGIPRYRFDHLTKMGWIKFLSLVLASILVEMLLIWIF